MSHLYLVFRNKRVKYYNHKSMLIMFEYKKCYIYRSEHFMQLNFSFLVA